MRFIKVSGIGSAVLGAGVLLTGCFGGSTETAAPQPQTQQAPTPPSVITEVTAGPAWTLSLQSNCVRPQDDQCIGKYGFAVTADGKYQVGPGPKGQIIAGKLEDAELTAINSKLDAAIAASHLDEARPENHEGGVAHESNDTVTLARASKSNVLVRNTDADFYFSTEGLSDAQALHKAIREIAAKHYRLPFGNDCGDAAIQVESLYANYQSCQTDSDCVYVDAQRGYEVIAPASVQWLLTDDCSVINPLLAANKLQILGGAAQLGEAYSKAAQTCGSQLIRSDCYYYQRPTSNGGPVCAQNRCQSQL